jgi:hypothetical protein
MTGRDLTVKVYDRDGLIVKDMIRKFQRSCFDKEGFNKAGLMKKL